MLNTRSLTAYVGHYPDTPLNKLIKDHFPVTYEKVIKFKKSFDIPFDLAFAAYASDSSPFCGSCKKPVRIINRHTVALTCSTRCSYKLGAEKANAAKAAKLTNLIKYLRKAKLPLSEQEIARIKNVGYAGKFKDWRGVVLSIRHIKKSFRDALEGSVFPDQLEHFLLTGSVVRCVDCNVILRSSSSKRCEKKCGSAYAIRKAHETSIKKFGGLGNASPILRKRMKNTMLDRYGVTASGASPVLFEKQQATLLRKYGVDSIRKTEKAIESHRIRHEDPVFLKKRRAKYRNTMRERYGEDWGIIMTEKMTRARYKSHPVTIGDKLHKVQGYEPYVINELLAQGCAPEHIIPYGKVITYFKPKNIKSRYIVDIWLPNINRCIEVKSTYTAGLHKNGSHMWRMLQRKSEAVAREGHSSMLAIVCPNKGIYALKEPHLLKRSDVLRLMNFKPFSYE